MKYTIYYKKLNKFGISDDAGEEEFDTFNELKYAENVLDNLEAYINEKDIANWDNVQKGDYLKFSIYAEAETEEEIKELGGTCSFIESCRYTGIIYGSAEETNK